MCIVLSLPSEYRRPGGSSESPLQVPVAVETLQYRSAERQVLVAFDFVATNRGAEPVALYLTHPDSVEGWLGTEDWFPSEGRCDDRMQLMQQVYGSHWLIDRQHRTLRYTDPVDSCLRTGTDEARVDARALSFSPPAAGTEEGPAAPLRVAPRSIDPTRTPYNTYRLRRHPEDAACANKEFLPYSTFRLGPIPGGTSAFARITLVIREQAYGRLVQPEGAEEGSPFAVISPRNLLGQIESEGLEQFRRMPGHRAYQDFFLREVKGGVLDPGRYHIIIAQPLGNDTGNKLVLFRPASSTISELYIADDWARERAVWLNAWSQDFRLVLAYEKEPHNSTQGPPRIRFRRRLPAEVAV